MFKRLILIICIALWSLPAHATVPETTFLHLSLPPHGYTDTPTWDALYNANFSAIDAWAATVDTGGGGGTLTGTGIQYYVPVWTSAGNLGTVAAIGAAGAPFLSGGSGAYPGFAGFTFSGTAGKNYAFPSDSAAICGTNAVCAGYQAALSFGNNVQTALAVNIGSPGSPLLNGGNIGTPSGGNISNCTFNGNAGTSSALAATPSQCGANQYATGIAANGNANCSTPAASAGSISGLSIVNDSSAPNSKVDVSAAVVNLTNSSGQNYTATNVSVVINFGANGANGLDIGTFASSRWYYIYLIYNGTTIAGLGSLSSTSPTLPSGYTYSKLLGSVRTASSAAQLLMATQQGGRVLYLDDQAKASGTTDITWTTQDCSALIPPISTRGLLRANLNPYACNNLSCTCGSGGEGGSYSCTCTPCPGSISVRKNGSSTTTGRILVDTGGGTDTDWVDISTAQKIDIQVSDGGNYNPTWYLKVVGYEINL